MCLRVLAIYYYRFDAGGRSQLHPLSHIPFGFGPRYCPGIEYCYLAIKMAIVSLLRKYTFVQAPDTEVGNQCINFNNV